MIGSQVSRINSAAPGRHAATIATDWCGRELGAPYAPLAWQLLADAARLGLMRHGSPEAWAASAIVLIARANHLVGHSGEPVSAQQVADALGVSIGALASTERQLTRALNLARYRHRPSTPPDASQSVEVSRSHAMYGFADERPRNYSVQDARHHPRGAP
jgi:hypothetical protein